MAHENVFSSQLDCISLVPNMFTKEDDDKLGQLISRAEPTKILKDCKKEKSPGPDWWGMELFLQFIDLMLLDHLEVGFISELINATFLALI